jgi:hypothetical protein
MGRHEGTAGQIGISGHDQVGSFYRKPKSQPAVPIVGSFRMETIPLKDRVIDVIDQGPGVLP